MQPHQYWYDVGVKDTENHEPIRDMNHNIVNLDTNIIERSENLVGYFRN